MKTTVIIVFFNLFVFNVLISQDICVVQNFILKINDEINVPSISTNSNNTITLSHNEQYITDIFSKYIIYDFQKAFPNYTSGNLKKYYNLKCSSKYLINELYETVPEDIIFIENKYQGDVLSEENTNFFSEEKLYSLKEYIATSDSNYCVFNCDLIPVPKNVNIAIKVYYDDINELLVMKSVEATSCGNTFTFKFKKKVNSTDNEFVVWETISDKPCFNTNNDLNCNFEATFFGALLGDFDLTFTISEFDFIIQTPNNVFGESVFRFEQSNLSVKDKIFSESIFVSPNPIKDVFSISINQDRANISKVSIFDYTGKEISKIENFFDRIDISDLSSGVYFLNIKTKKGSSLYKKIVKVK